MQIQSLLKAGQLISIVAFALFTTVSNGRVFYFRHGHETFPVFKQSEPLRVMANAARWLAPQK